MMRYLVVAALSVALLSGSVNAKPTPSKQASMTGGVRAVFDAASNKETVYGAVVPFVFTKEDAGKFLEVVADSPKPVTIEFWSGDIPKGATTWEKSHKFLGNSGKAPELKPSFRWMIDPGAYTALIITKLPPGTKPDPFVVTYGKEVRVPTADDTKEWDKAMAKITVAGYLKTEAKRPFIPNFSTIATDRNPISPQMYRGKTLLIEFTKGSDQAVMDDLGYNQETYRLHKDKGLDMITVYLDTDQTPFDAIQNSVKPEWREIFDSTTGNSAIADKYAIDDQALPETFLVDPAGRLVARDVHRDALRKLILAVCAEAKAYKEALALDDESPDTTDAGTSGSGDSAPAKSSDTAAK